MAINIKKLREMEGKAVAVDELYHVTAPEQLFTVRGSVSVQGQATHRKRSIFLDVRIRAIVVQQCSRCLADVVSPLDWEEHLEFQPEEDGEFLEREAFAYSLEETELSLQPYLVGLIESMLDPKPLCKLDCKGLCPICGQDLNYGECGCDRRREGDPRLQILKELLT